MLFSENINIKNAQTCSEKMSLMPKPHQALVAATASAAAAASAAVVASDWIPLEYIVTLGKAGGGGQFSSATLYSNVIQSDADADTRCGYTLKPNLCHKEMIAEDGKWMTDFCVELTVLSTKFVIGLKWWIGFYFPQGLMRPEPRLGCSINYYCWHPCSLESFTTSLEHQFWTEDRNKGFQIKGTMVHVNMVTWCMFMKSS